MKLIFFLVLLVGCVFGGPCLAQDAFSLGKADAPGWVLRSPTPDAPPCRAVRLGATVDTQLLRSRDGHLVLSAGHGDWEHSGGALQASFSFDDGGPMTVTGYPVGPIFLVSVTDDQLVQLRNAHLLHWHLPWGDFTADVQGLGAAFDAIGVCPD